MTDTPPAAKSLDEESPKKEETSNESEEKEEPKTSPLADIEFFKEARNRVKLYVLCDQRVWDDKGTGHVACVPMPEQPSVYCIVVQLEAAEKKNVLESKIQMDTAYQKQQETLIVWSESETCDLALSFQEKTGCEEIWAKICEVQGRDPEEGYEDIEDGDASDSGQLNQTTTIRGNLIPMPPCEMCRLPEIEVVLGSHVQSPTLRERMANTIENENFISKLCDVFRMCEDLDNTEGLRTLFNIVRHLFHLNRNNIIDQLFAEEHEKEILGMLEYDPSCPEPRKHREFIYEKTKFKDVLHIERQELRDKIRHAYVVQYVQDVCFPAPSIFEENLLSVLNSHLFFVRVEIVTMLMEEKVLKELFNELKDSACPVARRADLVKFLRELCTFSQALQNNGPNSRESFFKTLMQNDVLATIEPSILSPDIDTRITIIEVLVMLVEYNPQTVRDYVIRQEKDHKEDELLLNLLIHHMLNDKDAELSSAEQVAQVLRALLDPDNMVAHKTEKSEFLMFFYRRCINTLTKELLKNISCEKPVKDDYYTANVSCLAMRFLCFCVDHHGYNMRRFCLSTGLIGKLMSFLRSKHHLLALSTLKLLRSVCTLKDDFYIQDIIKNNAIDKVVACFVANGPRYNLLNSAIIELFDFIRQEDIKRLVKYAVEKHWSTFENIRYVKVFNGLKNRYDQYVERERPSSANDSQKEDSKGTKERMFDAEDQWFSQEDDEEEGQGATIVAAGGDMPARKTAAEPHFPSVSRGRVHDEEDEDGVFTPTATLNVRKQPSIRIFSSGRSSNSPNSLGISPERSRSPLQSVLGVDEVTSSQQSNPGSPAVSHALKTLSEYGDSDSDNEDEQNESGDSRDEEVSSTSKDEESAVPSNDATAMSPGNNKRRRTESPDLADGKVQGDGEAEQTSPIAQQPAGKKPRPTSPPMGVSTRIVPLAFADRDLDLENKAKIMVAKGNPTNAAVTVTTLEKDPIMELSFEHWHPATEGKHKSFDVSLIVSLYEKEIRGSSFNSRKIVVLELSQYLERYLWSHYSPGQCSHAHVMSIVVMMNEKFRERTNGWQCFVDSPEHFSHFMSRVCTLSIDDAPNTIEQCQLLRFLVNCFNSVEIDIVREHVGRLTHLAIWENLLPTQRSDYFKKNKKLRKYWAALEKQITENSPNVPSKFEREYLWKLIQRFIRVLKSVDDESKEVDVDEIHYCERFVELLIDLEALLPTRRFFNALLHVSHVIVYCVMSKLIMAEAGSLFCQLVTMLKFYSRFEIDEITGQQLSQTEVTNRHYEYVVALQNAAFKYFKESMQDFYLLNVSSVDTRKSLITVFSRMENNELYRFAEYLHLVPPANPEDKENQAIEKFGREFLAEAITLHCERRQNQLQQLNEQPLFPTEAVLWDENVVPYEHYSGEGVLALNKLNLQFLTLHDYLLRNFNLFQLESTYEIRQDLEDVLFRMKPWRHETKNETVWGGWNRMAQPLVDMKIIEVNKPKVSEKAPARVRAEFTVNIGKRHDIRQEWEALRKHDVVLLVCCRPKEPVGTKYDMRKPFKNQIDVTYVRGAEVEGMLDESGQLIEEYTSYERKPNIKGDVRRYRILLDANQYRLDMEKTALAGHEDVYYTFNLVVRRDPKTNNFKAVLSTIRQLLNTDCVVPDWLHDNILGYGDPDSAHYSKMATTIPSLDFNDTFLSYEHLVESFPGYEIRSTTTDKEKLKAPFRITFNDLDRRQNVDHGKVINVEPIVKPPRTPYPLNIKQNAIKFTPSQVEAIKSGMQQGLTMVVGPPGTGKTDVAVQIISNIYHNWPQQRTLIVTHSNQALNQLFEKIMELDIDERHLLRMGHGEEGLETEKDFSRYGRVNYVLKERIRLLGEVERLGKSIGHPGDVGYTCENAGNFYKYVLSLKWSDFKIKIENDSSNPRVIVDNFPFHNFFSNLEHLFSGTSYANDFITAESCWKHITHLFHQLAEFQAFEMLRNGRDRTEYLLVKEAKIIAMTCTHAALRRDYLVELGFRYDNILMEESAQILEVETFIPLLLQNPDQGRNRLKRWIMIGDHHQLPPVVQNQAFQKYSNMEQSLFARFVRLGVPTVLLDRQGRARAEIASLYSWRYKGLGNLPHVEALSQFKFSNAGFLYPFQMIDVGNFQGKGETTPSPYFYQNLGEAEYAVAIYTYMRILGYNGQAQLLRDVVERRCTSNPLIGAPARISTVDKYQGQQNDFIILSLVRTSNIGHIRDVRRLVVALSRARLGLIVLGRASLFRNCYELTPAFKQLCGRPLRLLLVPTETYPSERPLNEKPKGEVLEVTNTEHMCHFVHEFYKANMDHMMQRYEVEQAAEKERRKVYVPEIEPDDEPMETEEQKQKREEIEAKRRAEEAKKKAAEAEQEIVFEEMDFEKLEEVPKY
ncbi:unnamed protein product, partial [Mesorhabditis belari]|uniref:Uncharacterized protein n=1 Tax=Mesorhabditis belari TaxID=2138241 RepID=A0AAF3EG76_9BILA